MSTEQASLGSTASRKKARVLWLRWARTVHAYSALALGSAAILYALTGFAILHGGRFEERPTGMDSVEQVQLDASGRSLAAQGRAVAPELIEYLRAAYGERFGFGGETDHVGLRADGIWNITLRRPGRMVEIVIEPSGRTTIGVQDRGPVRSFALLHVMKGYDGPTWNWIWALMVDLCALSMLVFAITGVMLWWLANPTWIGAMCLFIGLSYPLASIAYLSWGP